MASRNDACLRCGDPIEMGFHVCPAKVAVIDPKLYRSKLDELHPLDRMSIRDRMILEGQDPDADRQAIENLETAMNQEYLNGPLTYRVEFLDISSLGFQGGIEYWAYTVDGHTDADFREATDELNSDSPSLPFLDKEETYLCRLVSLNSEGIRYLWHSKRLMYNKKWVLF